MRTGEKQISATVVLTKEQLNMRLRLQNAIDDLHTHGVEVSRDCDLTVDQLHAMAARAETAGAPSALLPGLATGEQQ
jgi:hypothetical protein